MVRKAVDAPGESAGGQAMAQGVLPGEFGVEEAAGPLAQHGFKKMRTLLKMDDRFS